MIENRPSRWHVALCWIQGLYYVLTGAWPIIDIRSFQLVTGEKTDHLPTGAEADHWLVMTVGVLILAIGLTLLIAAVRKTENLELAFLAMLSAAGLTAIDVIYTARKVIAPIYLWDAVLEIMLILSWGTYLARRHMHRQ